MSDYKYLAWIDLEMTGLDSNQDQILEIAAIVTDVQLNVVAYGPDLIIHVPKTALECMSQFVLDMHTSSGLVEKVLKSQVTLAHAQQQVLAFFAQYSEPGVMPLCGNSIWQDKLFLIKHMPKLVEFLHYRIIDVSTVKELVKNWYGVPEFKKTKAHRALSDIEESIKELKYYREHYFIK